MTQSLVFLGFTIAFAVLGISGCGKPPTPSNGAAKASQVTAAQKQFLGIEEVGAGKVGGGLLLPGRIAFRAQAQSAVGTAVPGRVAAVLVRAGEAVKAGAPLLIIDSADAAAGRATLDQTATRLASAEQHYKRQVEMMEKGVGLEIDRQDADARLKDARAEHERARHAAALIGGGQGSRVTLKAPSDGVVMVIRAAVGAAVAPGGEALVELGDPARLQVVAQVPEGELRRVAVGQEAEVELPGLQTRVAARVDSISPRVDPESRRMQLYLSLAARTEGLRAGMLAQVNLRVSGDDGYSVPTSAVLIKEGKRRVIYVERADGSFEAREVQVGRNRDGRVAILQGLKAGERIVVRGALLLDTQAEQLL
jgi:cobalt-zinc-cadmium efflux system membrane fusion protein